MAKQNGCSYCYVGLVRHPRWKGPEGPIGGRAGRRRRGASRVSFRCLDGVCQHPLQVDGEAVLRHAHTDLEELQGVRCGGARPEYVEQLEVGISTGPLLSLNRAAHTLEDHARSIGLLQHERALVALVDTGT